MRKKKKAGRGNARRKEPKVKSATAVSVTTPKKSRHPFDTLSRLLRRDGVVLATELRDAKPIIETPADVKQEQLKAVVVKYLNEHPEEHHKPAAVLVIVALSQAFPPQEKAAR